MGGEGPAVVLDLGLGGDGFVQTVAGESLWCDLALAPEAGPAPRPALERIREGETGVLHYEGPGVVAGRIERVRAGSRPEGIRFVEFESGDRFVVAADGGWIARTEGSPAATSAERRLELAVGAPLALALALRGTHLLHASAVAGPVGVVALAGESGVGKSTLAAAAAARPELGLARVADDILPVRLGAEPLSLPHFPQLKLASEAGYPATEATRAPLVAVLTLERRAEASPLELERLEGAAALAALIRAGVAVRLFDAELLAPHLEACARAAAVLPVLQLRFPSGERGLEQVLERLAEWAGREKSS